LRPISPQTISATLARRCSAADMPDVGAAAPADAALAGFFASLLWSSSPWASAALAANDSAKEAMGDDKLKFIAAELIAQVKKSVTIDWTLRESARARIKVMVKRILNKHGYPPDLQEEAVKTVLAQAELLCAEWV
jgi:hypothetical protein